MLDIENRCCISICMFPKAIQRLAQYLVSIFISIFCKSKHNSPKMNHVQKEISSTVFIFYDF